MALQDLTGYARIPALPLEGAGTAFSTIVLDAVGEKHAFIFRAPKTGNIRKLGFRTATVTTGGTFDVRLETVSLSTGEPTGTLYGTNTNVSQVIANADDNTWFVCTLTADAAVTFGDYLAIVIVAPSGCNTQIASGFAGGRSTGLPYSTSYLGGGPWAPQSHSALAFYFEYDDGTTAQVGQNVTNGQTSTSFNSGSTPDERALLFSLPFACKLGGFELLMGAHAAGSAFDVVLYDSDGTTALATASSFDGDVFRTASTNYFTGKFQTAQTLAANTTYRISVKPTTGNNVVLLHSNFLNTTVMGATDGGAAFQLSTRSDGGTWLETTTSRACIALLLSAFDDGASTGRPELRGANL